MPATETLIYAGYTSVILLSVWGLYCDRLPFSLNKLFWIFCLVFMGVSPLLQFAYKTFPFPWTQNQGNLKSFLATNNVVLCSMMVYGVIRLTVVKGMRLKSAPGAEQPLRTIVPAGIWVLLFAIAMQILLSPSLWLRQGADAPGPIHNSSLQLLTDKGLKGLVLAGILLSVTAYRSGRLSQRHLIVLTLLVLLANMPTAIPRYWLVCLYLALLISLWPGLFLLRRRLFEVAILAGLLTLFPLLSLIRQKDMPPLSAGPVARNAFCGQDFDAYASLRNTILYTEAHGIRKGLQLGTTLLFFVPRSVWPDKSIGSGAIVNPPRPGSDFNNYCSPIFAEGYLDFGFAGSLLWVALCAFVAGLFDRYYWQQPGTATFARLFYPAFLGLFFFILRGDLLSSFAYTTGIAVFAWLYYRMCTKTQIHQAPGR